MRLDKVQLTNFRNHEDSTLDLEGVTFAVIIGGNHEGKSSIGQAISVGLTNTTEGLDLQGRGFLDKIRRGAPRGLVTLHVRGKHLIEQTVKLDTNTTGRTSKARCLDDPDWHPLPFEEFLEYNRIALLVALNTDYFLHSLDEKGQKALLAKLALPDHYDFPEERVKGVEKFLGAGVIDFESEPFEAIDRAYSKLFAERTAINRQVRDFSIPQPLSYEGPCSKDLQQQIGEKRDAQRNLQLKQEDAVRKYSEARASVTRLQTRIAGYEARINEEGRRLEQNGEKMLTGPQLAKQKKLTDKEAEYNRLETERNAQRAIVEERTRQLTRMEEIPDAGTKCPTCDQIVDGSKLPDLSAKYVTEQKTAREKEADIWKQMAALGSIDDAKKAIAAHENAEREKGAIDSIINEQSRLLKSTRAELENIEAPGEDPGEKFRKPLDELKTDLDKLQDKLRPAISAEEREKEIARRTGELEVLQKKATEIDGLVKYFDKDGIKAKLLNEHIGAFQDKVNQVMAAWNYKCSFSIEPYEFNVTDAKGITTPVRELSGSEKHIFAGALQCAVSRAAEIGIVVWDRADTFTPIERQKVNECLFSLLEDGLLEQVFLIVADENEDREAPDVEGIAMFAVKDGKVTRIKAAVPA